MSNKSEKGRLPPGQKAIKRVLRWGKDHPSISGFIPSIDLKTWNLIIDGEVEKPIKLDWDGFTKLPMTIVISDFHCVEGWSVRDCKWEGVLFKNILELIRPKGNAKYVSFQCEDGYTTSFDIQELFGDDRLLAYKLNGEVLEPGLGFPVRLVVPDKYAYKSALWVKRIKFTTEKEQGFWEKRGYSDTADVWKNDRFAK